MRRPVDSGTKRLRAIVGIAGAVYLAWWFMVELLLPGSFNPLPGRLMVVGLDVALFGASYVSRFVERHLSTLFTAWACLLVAHYCYLIAGNGGDSTWWMGTFVTFAAVGMCMQSRREVAAFSVFSLGCVLYVAALEGQLAHSIYLPGLATILLLANITKRSQAIAEGATIDAENARLDSARADEQRFQLAAIVESSGDAIIGSSLDGEIRSFNAGAELLFGYRASEIIGRRLAVLLPAGREGEEPERVASLARGEAVTRFETVRRRRDGSAVDVSVTMSPIRDAGTLVGVSWVARDITLRKRAELEMRRAREAAESANRALEAFSYSVAHDLRAPLRAIDGFSAAVVENYAAALEPKAQDYLRRVRRETQRMGRLIDGLLELGRITRQGIRIQAVDLSALARSSAARLRELEPEREVELSIADGVSARGDGTLLGAVIDNLFSNAWKFTRDKEHPQIVFGCQSEAGQNAYFVRDNGAGFDMAYAGKLFGVFQRLHGQHEFEGTGVGLATAQRIVQRHGGRIWAEGKIGEGACIRFTLGEPIGPVQASEPPPASAVIP